ncbi:AEC family transporter [Corynebacterium suedekumii]|mgnify:CR=1 FL=1|uniref:AEC family transporter n=1 Tax=Corynebacterium suedekumii TaxID=3049801 RepID=A0ABY8VQH9_9CORY|nr:AEC family transporter [Corynebacterium suedekumii]WIM71256.1 AEC family transporter [Corynebacterium suedekumii]WIM73110.1 AEC family transporter [Corynebacterium suedekumii]
MSGVITGFAIILAVIGVGVLLARFGVINNDRERLVLNRVAFYAASPALLFTSVANSDASTLFSPVIVVIFLATAATSLIYILASLGFFRQDLPTTTMGAASSSYFNSVNIGLPVSIYVLGEATYVVPVLVLQMVIVTPFILAGLGAGPDEGGGRSTAAKIGDSVRTALLSPIVLGSFLGLIVAVAGISIPAPVMTPLEILGGASIPMILISFGASLRNTAPLTTPADRPGTIVATALKLVGMPLIAWLIGLGMGLDDTQLYAAVILAALPAAQNVYNYAATYQRGMIMARDTVFLTTFGSLPVMLGIALLFGR